MMNGWIDQDEYTRLAARIGGWSGLQRKIDLANDDAECVTMDLLMDHFGPGEDMDPGSQHTISSVCFIAALALLNAYGRDLANHPPQSQEALVCLAGLSWAAYGKLQND